MRHPGHLLWRRWMLPSARGKRWWAHFLFLESKPMALGPVNRKVLLIRSIHGLGSSSPTCNKR